MCNVLSWQVVCYVIRMYEIIRRYEVIIVKFYIFSLFIRETVVFCSEAYICQC